LVLPSPKRLPSARLLEAGLRAGRSKVLQGNHPYGPDFIFAWIFIFFAPSSMLRLESRFLIYNEQ